MVGKLFSVPNAWTQSSIAGDPSEVSQITSFVLGPLYVRPLDVGCLRLGVRIVECGFHHRLIPIRVVGGRVYRASDFRSICSFIVVAFQIVDHGGSTWLFLLLVFILLPCLARIPCCRIFRIFLVPLFHAFSHGIIRVIVIVPSGCLHVSLSKQFCSASLVSLNALSADLLLIVTASIQSFAFLSCAPVDVQELVKEGGGSGAQVGYVLLQVRVLVDLFY